MKYYIVTIGIITSLLLQAHSYAIQPPNIITREQRGADESLRRGTPSTNNLLTTSIEELKGAEPNTITSAQKRLIADNHLVTNFPQEFRTDETIRLRNNKTLLRPIQINHQKSKIIIHHTAQTTNQTNTLQDEINELQQIYQYHTINRRRGDIGYNFIIGPSGTIFEGRAGGPSAIGAHVTNNNSSSIGISLMGNFTTQEPTAAQIQSTIKLVARLASTYNINLYSKTTLHLASKEPPYIIDKIGPTFSAHKDSGDTACPGPNLYNKMSYIQQQANALQKDLNKATTYTDSTKYFIPNTTYQLSIPRPYTKTVKTCSSTSTVRDIAHCTLQYETLTLSLRKKDAQNHNGIHHITVESEGKSSTISLNLEYKSQNNKPQTIHTIPSKSEYFTGHIVNVLLYNASTQNNIRIAVCKSDCVIQIGETTGTQTQSSKQTKFEVQMKSGFRFQINKNRQNQLYVRLQGKEFPVPNIKVTALGGGSIQIENYTHIKNNTNLNERKGSLTRQPNTLTGKQGQITSGIGIINTLRTDDYLRGIIIADVDKPQSYNDVLYVAAHTNMRYRGSQLTDDPQLHQTYGGSKAESMNYKRQRSHDLYNGNILSTATNNISLIPQFYCSNGRTQQGIIDLGICPTTNTHPGNGLSLLGSQILSQRGYTLRQIYQYYFPLYKINKF